MLWNLPKSCKLVQLGDITFTNMKSRVMFVNLAKFYYSIKMKD